MDCTRIVIPIPGIALSSGWYMIAEVESKTESQQLDAVTTVVSPKSQSPKPNNPTAVKKAIALGKEIRKQPDKTKADALILPPI